MPAAQTANSAKPVATTILGRTGLTVSRLALGGYDALNQAGFERAIELGVNFLISFVGYEREQRAIGQAASHVDRGSMVLAAGTASRSPTSIRRHLKQSLATLGTDYADVFYLYHVTCDAWPKICAPGGALEQLRRARRAGRVRAVGVTVHNRDLARRIIASGKIDVINLRYSLAHPGHESRVLPAAMRQDCGVVAYSALKYGRLIRRPDGWPAHRRVPTPAECYRFALGHPGVHVAWAGARTIEQVEAGVRVIRPFKPLPAATERALRRFGKHVHDVCGGAKPSQRRGILPGRRGR